MSIIRSEEKGTVISSSVIRQWQEPMLLTMANFVTNFLYRHEKKLAKTRAVKKDINS